MSQNTRPQQYPITLRKFNNLLTIVVVVFGIYLIISPFMPEISLWFKRLTGQIRQETSVSYPDTASPTNVTGSAQMNKLVIPEIDIDHEIYEGDGVQTLNKGIWRRPKTSTPDNGGNTVLVAHRFAYNAPAVFYHLDKLQVGTNLIVHWSGKDYIYKIRETKIVNPDAIQVENNTPSPVLTLYTCTPMWTAKQRLVIIAVPIEDQS